MDDLITTDWYEYMVEDCKAIFKERLYRANIERIECFWEIGQRIVKDENYQKYAKGNKNFLINIFKDIGISVSEGYRAVQFYEKCPIDDVSLIGETIAGEEGKNLTWGKIKNRYLPQENGKTVEEECYCEKFMCIKCHKVYTKGEIQNLTK